MTGLAVDAGAWYMKKRDLQTAADAAAMTAGLQFAGGYSSAYMTSEATFDAERNGYNDTGTGTIQVNNPPTAGVYAGDENAIEVILTEQAPLYFGSMIINAAPTIQAVAVVKVFIQANMCMVALNETASQALDIFGSADLQMDCGMASNSNAADAIHLQGSVDVQAKSLWTVGGIETQGSVDVQVESQYSSASKIADPYADLAVPPYAGCDDTNYSQNNGSATIAPGVYCGGINVQGNSTLTMTSGTYIIDGGDFSVQGNADVSGTNVTIILTSSSGADYGIADLTGNGDVVLTPPESGDYSGILFYGDRNGGANTSTFTGSSDSTIAGVLYFPTQELVFTGSADVGDGCLKMLADTIQVSGSVDLQNMCVNDYSEEISSTRVRVVE